ncbi:MAG: S9 family peptidase [Fibrella sp.]|nr:S9 family peptidase [Armatimonadota bacterium]
MPIISMMSPNKESPLSFLRFSRFAFAALAVVFLCTPLSPVHADNDKRLTLDEALGFAGGIDQYGAIPRLRWLRTVNPGDPPQLLETRFESGTAALYRVDARTGVTSPLYDPAVLEAALAALPGMPIETAKNASRNASAFSFDDADRRVLITIKSDLYAYDLVSRRAARVTAAPTERRTNATLSPDGSHVAFVAKNDLYIAPLDWNTGKATPPRRVTTDGSEKIFNGRLDWVYEEELYGRGKTTGFRWSADSKRLVFLRLDDTAVPMIPIADELPRIPTVEEFPYPKSGDPNPKATLGIVSVAGENLPIVWTNLDSYSEDDRLIVRFGWAPDSARVVVQVQNRTQTFLHLLYADATTGKTTKVLEETSPAWVDILDEPRFLADGSFLWRSARTGFRHLYRYDAKGVLRSAVTRGDWDASELLAVDETNGTLCFAGNQTGATQLQVFRTRLDGSSGDAPKQMTVRSGTHDVSFDPSGVLFLDRWNDLNDPTQLRLHSGMDGAELRPLGANLLPITTRRGYKLSEPQLLTIKARDGYPLDAMILKPTDFSPAKKYPVIYCLYGGPASPTVEDKWGTVSLWHQYLAQQGCVVFMCDNRSASSKGVRNVWSIYKKLGESETRDIEDAIGYLKTLPYADTDRVGVYGWSYGGFLVEYLLTHTNLFQVGVAGAGVSDWRLYDTIYTERYMDTPQANPTGYQNTSPINAASKLNGKLLILHGTLDDNVHLQNTVQLIYALQRAGKPFDMMVYPRSRHGISDPALSRHMRTLLTNYLLDNLRSKP